MNSKRFINYMINNQLDNIDNIYKDRVKEILVGLSNGLIYTGILYNTINCTITFTTGNSSRTEYKCSDKNIDNIINHIIIYISNIVDDNTSQFSSASNNVPSMRETIYKESVNKSNYTQSMSRITGIYYI